VELWRIIASALLGAGGLLLLLMAMAQARESRGATTRRVVVTGLITFAIVAILTALVATVMPPTSSWVLVGLVAFVILVFTMTG
jgi:hypothetical protein